MDPDHGGPGPGGLESHGDRTAQPVGRGLGVGRDRPHETLPAGSDDHAESQGDEPIELGQEFKIVPRRLAEPDTRIEPYAFARHSGGQGDVRSGL